MNDFCTRNHFGAEESFDLKSWWQFKFYLKYDETTHFFFIPNQNCKRSILMFLLHSKRMWHCAQSFLKPKISHKILLTVYNKRPRANKIWDMKDDIHKWHHSFVSNIDKTMVFRVLIEYPSKHFLSLTLNKACDREAQHILFCNFT